MPLPYEVPGLRLFRGTEASPVIVKELQRDLRRLGYLASGIDGAFGRATEQAVKALQHDLLYDCASGDDGHAPVKIRDYNESRVSAENGVVDQGLAAAMSDMLGDERFTKVPSSPDPVFENRRIVNQLEAIESTEVPVPFL